MAVEDQQGEVRAQASSARLRAGRITRVESSAKKVRREPRPEGGWHLMVVEHGTVHLCHRGHEVSAGPGQLVLVDDRAGIELAMSSRARQILLELPRGWVERRWPRAHQAAGRPSAEGAPGDRYVAHVVAGLADTVGGMDADERAVAETTLWTVLPLATCLRAGRESSASWRFERALALIEAHAHEPGFDATALAGRLEVSRRYLDGVFSAFGATVAGAIRDRRLERAAEALHSPAHRRDTILEIALASGFVDSSHFARLFRRRYGVAPRAFRARPPTPGRAPR